MGAACVQWKFPLDTLDCGHMSKTCWIVDTCPNPDVSSENFYWTQALPLSYIHDSRNGHDIYIFSYQCRSIYLIM